MIDGHIDETKMRYEDLVFDFRNREIANNYNKIMETKNICAGLWYLSQRAHTIKEGHIIAMIVSALKEKGVIE